MTDAPTEQRWREVGTVGSLTVAVEDGCVILGDLWALNAGQRDRFMRLWCEAERQAEATMPP